MSIKKILIFSFVFIFFQNNLFSQDNFENYQFQNVKEGISKRAVSTIVQDHRGYMWFGTNGAGLFKYDGVKYEAFEYDWKNTKSINSNLIYSLFIDSFNNLWIGTEEGISLYDRNLNQFKNFDLKKIFKNRFKNAIAVKCIIEDDNNNLLLGTYGCGLIKMNLKTFKVSIFKTQNISDNNYNINCLSKNENGKIFLGTNFGLKELDTQSNIIKQVVVNTKNETITDPIQSMVYDKSKNLWIGTDFIGIIKLSKEGKFYKTQNIPISKKRILALIENKKTIYCATENDGLFLLDSKGTLLKNFLNYKFDEKSLKSNSVWSLFSDKNERIWLGYYNKGVGIFDKPYIKFNTLKSAANNLNSLQSSSVTGIIANNEGVLWISLDGGGVDVYDPKTKKITHINNQSKVFSGLNSNDIQTIFIDNRQNIWLGTWNEGIYFLKKGTTNFINFNSSNTKGLTSNRILSFSEDQKGRVWIGTFMNGLHYFDIKTNQFFHCDTKNFVANGLDVSYIRKVLVDSDDNLWVGTTEGLFEVISKNDGNFEVKNIKFKSENYPLNHKSTQTILSIFESRNKIIWIGTDGAGLFSFDKNKNKFFWYNNFEGFKEKSVASIIESNAANIWIGGKSGITVLDLKSKKATNYTTDDGLLVNDFNNNAVYKDRFDNLYFGSYEGMNFFNINEISTKSKQSVLYFDDFKLFNKSVSPNDKNSPLKKVISETKEITLQHDQSVFSIDYLAIDYDFPSKHEYAYYLEGFEKNWNFVGSKKTATYTNLAAGKYIFKVKSTNRGELWNDKTLELTITILPPWWKTNLAYFIYILLLLSSAYFLNKFFVNRFKQKQAIQFERDKNIQIEKLNEKKLQFFTNISHEFRTPLTLIINPLNDIIRNKKYNLPSEVSYKLQTIHKSSDRLSRLINELMDFNKLQSNQVLLQVQQIEVIGFAREIVSYFEEEASSRKIDLIFKANVNELNDWLDPKMFEKIIFNLISNAFKVTADNGKIEVTVNTFDSYFQFSVKDNGSGLEKKELKKIFERFYQVNNLNKSYYGSTGIGLEVVKSFVDLHKGTIDVESKVGIGTQFSVNFPLGKTMFAENEILDTTFQLQTVENFTNKSNEILAEDVIEEEKKEKTHTILIVEDNAELRNYLKNELKSEYKVLVAENGLKGYELATEKLPDLILTDVIMPVMDGLELCKKIKRDIKTSHIPLLMLSAKAMVQDKLDGIDSGADIYLSKPFEIEILKSSLIQLIASRQILFNKYYNGISKNAKEKTTTLDKDFIQKILTYINENISETDLSVEILASKVFISRSQLYRKIKTLTGVSVNEFIRNVRLEKAKELLELGNNNITEISYKVGFTSPSYFTKCFKSKYGYPPKSNH